MLEVGDLVSSVYMLNNFAYLEVTLYNNHQAAINRCQQALEHMRYVGLPGSEALILCSLGEIALMAGNSQAARDHLAASLRIAVEFNLVGEVKLQRAPGWPSRCSNLTNRPRWQRAISMRCCKHRLWTPIPASVYRRRWAGCRATRHVRRPPRLPASLSILTGIEPPLCWQTWQ